MASISPCRLASSVIGALILAACAESRINRDPVLYRQLGETPGIRAIVNDLIDFSVADARIGHHFAGKDIPHIKRMVVEQFCFLTGGPCRYSGLDMKTTHLGLGVDQADFSAFVENLRKSFEKHGVPEGARNGLLRLLAPMRKDIVEK